MNLFKIILFSILLIISPLISIPKSSDNSTTQIDRNGYVYNWKMYNRSCSNCESFYYKIERTIHPDKNGFYFFYLYFYSNTFSNGVLTFSYIKNINVYSVLKDGTKQLLLKPFYIVVPPKSATYDGIYRANCYLYSVDPQQVFDITFGEITSFK